MRKSVIFLLLLMSVFTACKNDFDLNAPYKETMIIYGLLNLRDSDHYIRIGKGYLGDGNALVMAQQKDSINYRDVLEVKMEQWKNGLMLNSYLLDRIDSIAKEPGVFASPYQVHYVLRNHNADPASTYRLVATNTETGYTAISQTSIVSDVNIINPSPADVDFSNAAQFSVKFNPGSNSRIYDLVIRFHYTEDSSGVMSYHVVDWNFPDQFVTNATEISFPYFRPDLYALLAANIPVKAGVTRVPGTPESGNMAVEFRVIAGTEDLHTYQQLNSPSNNSLQEPPLFTTVENGLGLFTSRLIRSEYRNLNARSKDSLIFGSRTSALNFNY